MSKRLVACAVLLLAGAGVVSETGCSFIIDAKPEQCSTDGDCRSRGEAFTDSFCSADKTCVRAVDYCATNVECIERLGNEASICRKDTHKCVALITKQCKLLADKDDLRNDEAVIIGSHGIPSWAPQTQACESSLELVRRDFKSTQGGLPPSTTSGGKPRPVVFLSCDVPAAQQDLHKAVTDHLFDTVGVPILARPVRVGRHDDVRRPEGRRQRHHDADRRRGYRRLPNPESRRLDLLVRTPGRRPHHGLRAEPHPARAHHPNQGGRRCNAALEGRLHLPVDRSGRHRREAVLRSGAVQR